MILGQKIGKDFWKAYNRFFKPKAGNFRPIKNGNEKYLGSSNEIVGEFTKTFFEARHLQQETFNRVHEAHVNAAVASSNFFDTTDNDYLSKNISECELVGALKTALALLLLTMIRYILKTAEIWRQIYRDPTKTLQYVPQKKYLSLEHL